MDNKPEILAPAGDWEAFLAAVENGADAVYLGGKGFNARQYAGNFDEEELRRAVQYAHLRGVRIYVTVNILVDDGELPDLIPYVRFLYEAGADALIVQDLGLVRLIRTLFPGLELHASTQMTVHNLEGARLAEQAGLARVVLARELSLADIRRIRAGTEGIGLEAFVHGALCISYSGQCLMSSLIGGRSGNRGRCAQPCRLEYTLVDHRGEEIRAGLEGVHLLSPRDLKAVELLPDLAEAGISAFKIEGRMKRPEYVATVVSVYRRAVDRLYRQRTTSSARREAWSAGDPETDEVSPGEGDSPPAPAKKTTPDRAGEGPGVDAATFANGAASFTVPPEDQRRLAQIFNRDFTTGHLLGNPGRDLMSYQRPSNRGLRLGRVVAYDREKALVTLKLEEPLNVGDGVEFWVSRGGRIGTEVKEIRRQGRKVPGAESGELVTFPAEGGIRPGDRVFKTLDKRLVEEVERSYRAGRPLRKIPLSGRVRAAVGQPLRLWLSDDQGNTVEASTGFLAVPAEKHPLTQTVLEEKLGRLGNTPFQLENLKTELENGILVPLSELNEVRRKAIEKLVQRRLVRERPPLEEARLRRDAERILSASSSVRRELVQERGNVFPDAAGANRPVTSRPQLAVHVADLEAVLAALQAGSDCILFGGEFYRSRGRIPDLEEMKEALRKTRGAGRKFGLVTARIGRLDDMASIYRQLEAIAPLAPDLVTVGNLGTLALVRETGLPFWANFSLNVFNSLTIDFLADLGAQGVILSPELNLEQIRRLVGRTVLPLGGLIHGPLAMMVSEYCAVGSLLGDRRTGKACRQACWGQGFGLKDRLGLVFPIEMDEFCRMHIFNPMELVMLDHLPELVEAGLTFLQIEARRMPAETLGQVVSLYRRNLDATLRDREDYRVPAQDMERMRRLSYGPEITRGHYFRGVL